MMMMGVYLHGSYTTMKKLSIESLVNLIFILNSGFLIAQVQFLERRPYETPNFEQYPSSACVDHHHPYTNVVDNLFLRFDGYEFNNNIIAGDCRNGRSCYDGHPGTDYFMPFSTPILAPAGGYVLWASFSPAADPCPGGIESNGDQGTIIIAHGNDYFTVYLHMTSPLEVEVGQTVDTGDTLGYAGDTGCATSTHLHFEVRKGNWFFDSIEPYVVDPFGWWGNLADPIEEFRGNRSEWLWLSESLVDDGDNGFERFQGPDWAYLGEGFNNDSWMAPATSNSEQSRHYAIWVPTVESGIEYNLEAFIPSGINATTGAIYEIYIKDESGTSSRSDIVINQSTGEDSFVVINTLVFDDNESIAIILRDLVLSGSSGDYVVFDAIRVIPSTMTGLNIKDHEADIDQAIRISNAHPNPFNSSITIGYQTENSSTVSIRLFDIFGRVVFSKNDIKIQAGKHSFSWDGKNSFGIDLPSGVYYFSISSKRAFKVKKVVLLK